MPHYPIPPSADALDSVNTKKTNLASSVVSMNLYRPKSLAEIGKSFRRVSITETRCSYEITEAMKGLFGLVRGEVAAVRGELAAATKELATVKEELTAEKGEMTVVKGELAVVRDEVARQNERVVMLEERNEVLENEVNELRHALGVVGERSVATAAVVEERGRELEAVKRELSAVTGELEADREEVGRQKERVLTLEEKNQILGNEVNELRRTLGIVGERCVATGTVVEERQRELIAVKGELIELTG
ncbi:unnamed protein product [Closterium sp. NIES-65]|nr:unnamed protein product [Closterium sp. NIES-65]